MTGFIEHGLERIARRKGKLARSLRRRMARWSMENDLRLDPGYNPDSVEEGFQDRRSASRDPELLRRITRSYNKAKAQQASAPPCYQVSNEWLPIYTRYMGTVMNLLAKEDHQGLQEVYENFWRDPCSTGLLGLSFDMQARFASGRIKAKDRRAFLNDTIHRIRLWTTLLGKTHSLQDLSSPLIGNPYGFTRDGVFIKSGADYLHYYAVTISRLLRRVGGRKVVMELGGGFGGMAYYLIRDNPDCAYVDFDLPENMALTAYYLLSAHPEKKALLFGEGDLTAAALRDNDIILMPGFAMQDLPSDCVDLSFNSYSLAEMSPETIATYIGQISRVTRQFFLHINHTRNSVLGADDFGIDPARFDLLYRAPALWNLARNPDMDEFEYLYWKIDAGKAR